MKIWKTGIVLYGMVALLLCSFNVAAVNDGTNDVWHQKWTGTGYSWEAYTGTKSNIDITDISYTIDGTTATVTMTTVGDMSPNTENVVYTMHLRSGETDFYMIIYTNGQGAVTGMGGFMGFGEQLVDPISGNTFTASFEVNDPNLDYEIIGFNAEYTDVDAEQGEAWWDYAPNTEAPYYGTGGDGDDDGTGDDDTGDDDTNGDTGGDSDDDGTPPPPQTPGFEAVAVIAALAMALFVFKKSE